MRGGVDDRVAAVDAGVLGVATIVAAAAAVMAGAAAAGAASGGAAASVAPATGRLELAFWSTTAMAALLVTRADSLVAEAGSCIRGGVDDGRGRAQERVESVAVLSSESCWSRQSPPSRCFSLNVGLLALAAGLACFFGARSLLARAGFGDNGGGVFRESRRPPPTPPPPPPSPAGRQVEVASQASARGRSCASAARPCGRCARAFFACTSTASACTSAALCEVLPPDLTLVFSKTSWTVKARRPRTSVAMSARCQTA
mmetsp:Transcript_36450/g.80090  ORF Transcript_36450/g.80090 Transcript_36450/m.80090 type:complete len:258 (+) Transcript_36450:3510-4283(+)